MAQGFPREFLHPRRGSHLYRLHVDFDAQARLSMSPHWPAVMSGAGWRSAAARRAGNENESERTRLLDEVPRSAGARPILTMTVARREWEGGISGGVRPHPPAAHLLPGEPQLRRLPSRRERERGAGVAESRVRNHKLEREREGEKMEIGGTQRKYIFFSLKKKKTTSNFRQHEWALG